MAKAYWSATFSPIIFRFPSCMPSLGVYRLQVLFDLSTKHICHTHIFLPLAFPSFHLLIKLANFDVENFFCRFLTKEREVNLLLSTEIKPRTSSIYFKKRNRLTCAAKNEKISAGFFLPFFSNYSSYSICQFTWWHEFFEKICYLYKIHSFIH